MPDAAPTRYRLDPSVAARFVGLALVLLALLVLVGTALVSFAGLPGDAVVVLAAAGLLGVLALAWWLRAGLAVVRFDDAGYRVRMVRGAGTKQAAWTQVQEVSTASPRGIRCVVLRLVDGSATTIPVDVLAADGDALVRELQVRLRHGEGLRPF